MKENGFTLIELLLVISIISLLSTVFFFNATEAKKKGEDAHMKTEASEVQKAIELYKLDNNGRAPGNTNGRMVREGSDEYASSMQELVNAGYLSEIPTSPSGDSYAYMTTEDGTGAVFAANLNFDDPICKTSNYNYGDGNSCDGILAEVDEEDDVNGDKEISEEELFRADVYNFIEAVENYKADNNGQLVDKSISSSNGTMSSSAQSNFDKYFSQYISEFPMSPNGELFFHYYYRLDDQNLFCEGARHYLLVDRNYSEYFSDWYNGGYRSNTHLCYPLE